jgi:MFS family permease
MSISFGFSTFLIAEIILGIGGSFISGADSALLYDSLQSDNRQHYYLRYEGRITAMGNLGETLAALGGGLLAVWLGYRSVYTAQTLIAAIGIPAALLLVEPLRIKHLSRPSFGEILEISRQALLTDRKLGGAILAGSVAGTATLGMAWTAQVYFVDQGFTEKEITPLWVLLNLVVGGVSLYSGAVVARLGTPRAILISSTLPAGFILLGILPLYSALIMLIIFYLIRGYTTPMFRDLINQNCDSSVRATVLSIRSLLVRLLFSLGGPAIGYLAGFTSLKAALVVFGLVLGLLSLLSTAFLFRHHHVSAGGGESEGGSSA